MSSKKITILLTLLLTIPAVITRFYGLTWGDGIFYHPDENNMATAISQLSSKSLNPHFFAYGQFPLYLGYFSLKLLDIPNTFQNAIFVLRFYSALFSLLTLIFVYLISKELFKNTRHAFLVLCLTIFSPGLIQLAHYGTTESLLILIFAINIYLAFSLLKYPFSISIYLFSSIINGIGMGSKLSSVILCFPLFFVSLLNLFRNKFNLKIIFLGTLFILFSLLNFIITSPYNLIEKKDFLSAFDYESGVATGRFPVFYTTQFNSTTPYLFQIIKIFPYGLGLTTYAFGVLGIFMLFKIYYKSKKLFSYWLIILLSSLFYFAYFGQLFVKWSRFMSPLFITFPLFVWLFISTINNRYLKLIFFVSCIFPGIYFFRIYFYDDIRTAASNWMINNLPTSAKILSEAGNVVNIPIGNHQFNVINFDFYNLDINPELKPQLVSSIKNSDYILIPSRRIFRNQKGDKFPISEKYYQALFSGQLGFKQVVKFAPTVDWILDSENAEETWSVFDHPTIRLYQKTTVLTDAEYDKIFSAP